MDIFGTGVHDQLYGDCPGRQGRGPLYAAELSEEKTGPELEDNVMLPWRIDADSWEAKDDVRGGPLDVKAVADARATEMQYVHGRKIYKYSTKSECRRLTGKNPIKVRWVDTDKGGLVRARLVAMEFRIKNEAAIFAGTPPL